MRATASGGAGHRFHSTILREYDVRGIVGETLFTADALALGRAFATMVRRIIQACGGSVRGTTIAILGVTFKPNTDDVRDSPSLVIVPALQAEGATVRAHDPEGMKAAGRELPQVVWCEDMYDAMDGADAVVILTEWNAFRALDLKRVRDLLRRPIVVDLRNVYEPAEMIAAGFSYTSIGRPVLDLNATSERKSA